MVNAISDNQMEKFLGERTSCDRFKCTDSGVEGWGLELG